MRAQQAFLAVLDEYNLDDFQSQRPALVALLDHSLRRGNGTGD
jgi:hypothetical protein